jgi:hypothetical protein
VKLLDWIKNAVGLIKAPAHPQQDRPQPHAPQGNGNRTVAEVARPDAETPPERPIRPEPAGAARLEPESPVGIEPDDRISVEPEKPISTEPASLSFGQPDNRVMVDGSPDPEEIDRRRAVVRAFFNDYWSSVEDKPASFAERLDGAEAYINERVAAGGEVWRLDPATRKLLGLPPSKRT